jgi:hypothetical protein
MGGSCARRFDAVKGSLQRPIREVTAIAHAIEVSDKSTRANEKRCARPRRGTLVEDRVSSLEEGTAGYFVRPRCTGALLLALAVAG